MTVLSQVLMGDLLESGYGSPGITHRVSIVEHGEESWFWNGVGSRTADRKKTMGNIGDAASGIDNAVVASDLFSFWFCGKWGCLKGRPDILVAWIETDDLPGVARNACSFVTRTCGGGIGDWIIRIVPKSIAVHLSNGLAVIGSSVDAASLQALLLNLTTKYDYVEPEFSSTSVDQGPAGLPEREAG